MKTLSHNDSLPKWRILLPSRDRFVSIVVACAVIIVTNEFVLAQEGEETSIDFNREVRPILSKSCLVCHGPDAETREAGLRLDRAEEAVAELDSGLRAIIPGNPEESELHYRVTTDDESLRMPPVDSGAALTKAEQETLRLWIEQGASYEQHWSFVPPVKADLPSDESLARPIEKERIESASPYAQAISPIDRFVFAKLKELNLQPEPKADRYTLIRRVALDLTGLPPSREEVDRFIHDDSPDAVRKMVDSYLAMPTYGEKWGAIWLDLARYADSQGYAQDTPRTIWRYRDWVIQAINENMPFDQFTIEQIAGDLLEQPSESQKIATAFHRNTMTNSEGGTDDEEFRVAAVVDRVNTTMQVWMGMTIGCAQCHTHKYDPISQEEYFRLYDIFNQTADQDRPNEAPTLASFSEERSAERTRLQSEIAQLQKDTQASAEPQEIPLPNEGPIRIRFVRVQLMQPSSFLHLAEVEVFDGDTNVALQGTASQSSTDFGGKAGRANDGNTDGDYEVAASSSHTAKENMPWWEVDLGEVTTVERIVVWNRTDTDGVRERLKPFRVIAYNEAHKPVWVAAQDTAPNPKQEFIVPTEFKNLTPEQRSTIASLEPATGKSADLAKLQDRLNKLGADIQTPIMEQLPEGKRRETRIHIRGSFRQPGDVVTAGVPAVFPPLSAERPADRLNLARWLVSPDNPLTARVVVNRYWEHLFGRGLVETSEDFGTQGQLPSHPQLLDWLAVDFMENGWDTKRLVRQIVLSDTYQQSSRVRADKLTRDPYNAWLSRGPRFRLSAEEIRDQALAVSELLSDKMFGPSVRPPRPQLGLRAAFGGSTDWSTSPGEDRFRRGLYTFARRTSPYPSMMTFDATSREICTIRRIRTNTPLQALVTLNDPVFVEAAQGLARRVWNETSRREAEAPAATDQDRCRHAFELVLIRPPRDEEVEVLVEMLRNARTRFVANEQAAKEMATDPIGPLPEDWPASELAAWTVVANVLLNLDETLARP